MACDTFCKQQENANAKLEFKNRLYEINQVKRI
ncbi:MAG: hypothetical protein ACI9V1_000579 [Spirosomataceae bacterium]|jgi:hypothetical protein